MSGRWVNVGQGMDSGYCCVAGRQVSLPRSPADSPVYIVLLGRVSEIQRVRNRKINQSLKCASLLISKGYVSSKPKIKKKRNCTQLLFYLGLHKTHERLSLFFLAFLCFLVCRKHLISILPDIRINTGYMVSFPPTGYMVSFPPIQSYFKICDIQFKSILIFNVQFNTIFN